MLRGLAAEGFTIHAANMDLHSGLYGGPAINPIRVLTKILGSLHDDEGRVTIPGFYEGVPQLTNSVKAKWDALEFNTDKFLGDVGLTTPAGEKFYPALEQMWSRPTCDINGINGGYTGDGFKTVLPAMAHAKVSFRLVGQQDPEAISPAFRKFIRDNLPPDCTVEFHSEDRANATDLPVDAREFALAQKALGEEWPNEAMFIGMGGSIPIVGHFQQILGMDSVLIGFGQANDLIHSPNEKYDLRSFEKGTRSWIRVLHALQA
ncbi:MAG: M20/M25/M40 family metallo-hydrolase [Paracoccaceae bacterium]